MESGPRLSNEGPMRSSAEAYLKGSTEVCVLFTFASYLMVDTHSSLKTTSLGLDLSSTGPSGLNTGRDENIHFLTNLDDDEESEALEKKFDIYLHDVGELGYEESDEPSEKDTKEKSPSDSSSDDYNKDVDFGIDKNISERILDVDMLAPGASNDFELGGSQSLKSTTSLQATDRADPTGKSTSMMDVKKKDSSPHTTATDNERKEKAHLAALAAEKRVRKMSPEGEFTDMTQEMLPDMEERHADLIKEREDRLVTLKNQILLETEAEERKLLTEKEITVERLQQEMKNETEAERKKLDEMRTKAKMEAKEEETKLREQMERKLKNVREEVELLQKDEYARLEREKKAMLESIKQEVEEAVGKEREQLEADKEETLAQLEERLQAEVVSSTEEMEKKHAYRLEQARQELAEKHEQEMAELKLQLEKVHLDERKKEEVELKAAQQRKAAIEDLEKGLDEVLTERKQQLKEIQQQQLDTLKTEHQRTMRRVQEEYTDQERKEEQASEDRLEKMKEDLEQKQERELTKMKEEFETHKLKLKEDNDKQKDGLQVVAAELKHRKEELRKQMESLQLEEKNFEERKQMFQKEQKAEFEQQKDEAFAMKSSLTNSEELDALRKEYRRLQQLVQEARRSLEALQKEQADLQAEVDRLRLMREQNEHKLSETKKRLSEAEAAVGHGTDSQLGGKRQLEGSSTPYDVQHEAGGESSSAARGDNSPQRERMRKMVQEGEGRRRHEGVLPRSTSANDLSTAESVEPPRRTRRRSETEQTMHHRYRSHKHLAWEESEDTSTLSDDLVRHTHKHTHHRDMREHLAHESASIRMAREFLMRQKQTLRQRQTVLRTAQQQWSQDMLRHQLGVLPSHSAMMLGDVKSSLDKEAADLDRRRINMSTGSKLLKEKERNLRQLETSLLVDKLDEGEEGTHNLDHYMQQSLNLMTNGDLSDSDEESSGISLTDFNVEDQQAALQKPVKTSTPLTHVVNGTNMPVDDDGIRAHLQKLDKKLQQVMDVLKSEPQPAHVVMPLSAHTQTTPEHRPTASVAQTTNAFMGYRPCGVTFGSAYEGAEQGLEHKWRKYFGDTRAPVSLAASFNGTPGNILTHVPVREQLEHFRASRLEAGGVPVASMGISTEAMLAEHREWLRRFHSDVRRVMPNSDIINTKALPTDMPSLNGTVTISNVSSANRLLRNGTQQTVVPSVSALQGNIRQLMGSVKLELDENNTIQVRRF
ncbi:hypothetical protein NP493_68g01001 [Ridgeia piscesae]|uniref:Uncharacterized protein n=1 Tax=Ridgeia piscesae TaxID=27915 RepID=A0AAD9P9M1_RIDPI|nr:hypothetical protein NP493_68g01001 [Ridgeia piscesae]